MANGVDVAYVVVPSVSSEEKLFKTALFPDTNPLAFKIYTPAVRVRVPYVAVEGAEPVNVGLRYCAEITPPK
jgi:hypothetical protein